MTDTEQKSAARSFVKTWIGRGDEKQDTQSFWLAFLRDVFGVEKPEEIIRFELPVKLSHTSFIDCYIENTHVLIEQKGRARTDLFIFSCPVTSELMVHGPSSFTVLGDTDTVGLWTWTESHHQLSWLSRWWIIGLCCQFCVS